MLSRSGRPLGQIIFGPFARLAIKLGISADAITIAGTLLTVVLALTLFPTGHLLLGSILVAIVVIFDNLDGQVARLTGTASKWGAFLDSTLDRVADFAIFLGMLWWEYRFADAKLRPYLLIFTVLCLGFGQMVPYARARAESLGANAAIGLAERADRLVVSLVATGFTGLGMWQWILLIIMILLALASAWTVLQRMVAVKSQLRNVK